MRTFDTGATRNSIEGKLQYEGFLAPTVLESYAEYMNKNRVQADGSTRAADNWQAGISKQVYMDSAWRHFMDVWKECRGHKTPAGLQENLNALLFNIMGLSFENLKEQSKEQNDYETDKYNKRDTVLTKSYAKLHRSVEVRPVVGRLESEGDVARDSDPLHDPRSPAQIEATRKFLEYLSGPGPAWDAGN